MVSTNLVQSANVVLLHCQIKRTGFKVPVQVISYVYVYKYMFWETVFCDTIVRILLYCQKYTKKTNNFVKIQF